METFLPQSFYRFHIYFVVNYASLVSLREYTECFQDFGIPKNSSIKRLVLKKATKINAKIYLDADWESSEIWSTTRCSFVWENFVTWWISCTHKWCRSWRPPRYKYVKVYDFKILIELGITLEEPVWDPDYYLQSDKHQIIEHRGNEP